MAAMGGKESSFICMGGAQFLFGNIEGSRIYLAGISNYLISPVIYGDRRKKMEFI